jgi:predicted MPP superfamily phosphohydrolase
MLVAAFVAVAVCFAGLVYGWWEAGWLRRRVIDVAIPGLDPALDGLRVAHLSDFHLGMPSRGRRATEDAVAWVAGRRPDLVCITGDLVSHPRGEPLLRSLLGRLDSPLVVLGNHDVAVTRDPFSRKAELDDLAAAVLLRDAAVTCDRRGRRISVVGVDPVTFRRRQARPEELVDPAAGLRVLLCHFPDVHARLPERAFHLTLAGHLHAGQIVLPLPGRRVTLAHPRATQVQGVFRSRAGVLHISPGLGTTFVPFRFCARPEVTELVLRKALD